MSIGVMTLGISLSANAQSIKSEKEAQAAKEMKAEKDTKVARASQTWTYNGTASDSPTDASKYTLDNDEPCGIEQETVCKLFAPASSSNSSQPDMSATVSIPGQASQTITQRINDAVGGASKHTNETVLSLRPL